MLKHTRNKNNGGIRFYKQIYNADNIAPKLQKCSTHNTAFEIISNMLKQPNFFHSQPSTLPKDAPAKFYLSTAFGLSFMINSVAPTRASTSYAYSFTKIGNRNLKWKPNLKVSLFVFNYQTMFSFCLLFCILRDMLRYC